MRINAIAFSTNGCRTAIRLKEAFPEEDLRIFAKTQCDTLGEGRRAEFQNSLRYEVYVALCSQGSSQENKVDLISRQNYSCHHLLRKLFSKSCLTV